MRHWRTVLPEESLLEVPYEALVAEPELWSRRMVEPLWTSDGRPHSYGSTFERFGTRRDTIRLSVANSTPTADPRIRKTIAGR